MVIEICHATVWLEAIEKEQESKYWQNCVTVIKINCKCWFTMRIHTLETLVSVERSFVCKPRQQHVNINTTGRVIATRVKCAHPRRCNISLCQHQRADDVMMWCLLPTAIRPAVTHLSTYRKEAHDRTQPRAQAGLNLSLVWTCAWRRRGRGYGSEPTASSSVGNSTWRLCVAPQFTVQPLGGYGCLCIVSCRIPWLGLSR